MEGWTKPRPEEDWGGQCASRSPEGTPTASLATSMVGTGDMSELVSSVGPKGRFGSVVPEARHKEGTGQVVWVRTEAMQGYGLTAGP